MDPNYTFPNNLPPPQQSTTFSPSNSGGTGCYIPQPPPPQHFSQQTTPNYTQPPPQLHHPQQQQEPIHAENPIPINYFHHGEEMKTSNVPPSYQQVPINNSTSGGMYPQHPYVPSHPQENYTYNVIISPTNDVDQDAEGRSANSSFSLSICVSILFSCLGCFPLSCVPFWFVYATYRDSVSMRAQHIAYVAKILFWMMVGVNICLFCISLFIVVIVPPVVVIPRYY